MDNPLVKKEEPHPFWKPQTRGEWIGLGVFAAALVGAVIVIFTGKPGSRGSPYFYG